MNKVCRILVTEDQNLNEHVRVITRDPNFVILPYMEVPYIRRLP